MANLLLNKYQMRTLLDMAELTPAGWSPLIGLPSVPRGCAPGEPDFEDLMERGLVVRDGAFAWRLNHVGATVLAAVCVPEEIIGVKPNHSRIPGFAIVRLGELVCECTVEASTGDTKLVFPISRSAVILRFIQSLTNRSDEPTPMFSVDLDRNESFLLSVVARLEVTEVADLTLNQLYDAARTDLDDRVCMSALAAGGILPELTPASDLGPALAGLERAGVVAHSGTRVGLTEAAQILAEPARAAFTITRVEVHDGRPRRDGMLVTRHGDRTLVLRTTTDDEPRVVWTEVTRAQLRALIAAFLLPRDELAAWVAHEEGDVEPAAPGTAVPEPATPPVATPVAAVRVSVPPQGMPAFDTPTLDRPPIAQLQGGVVLTVVERQGTMAHVRADNGWEGWVAHHLLVPADAVTVRVPPQGLPAFDSPLLDHPPIAMLAAGVVLTVVERQGTMAHVRADNGWEGWVTHDLLLPS